MPEYKEKKNLIFEYIYADEVKENFNQSKQ